VAETVDADQDVVANNSKSQHVRHPNSGVFFLETVNSLLKIVCRSQFAVHGTTDEESPMDRAL
jgi:hypothetical protein